MAKIDIKKLTQILHRNESDIQKINDILNDIKLELEIEQQEREARPPSVKKQFITLIADHQGNLKGEDLVTWIVQIPENANHNELVKNIHQAAHKYNSSPKGGRFPVKSIGETLESVSAKIFKEQGIWVKTKLPAFAVSCTNQISKSKKPVFRN